MAIYDATQLEAPHVSRENVHANVRVLTLPWHRLALGAILLLAALLDFWQLDRLGYSNTFYAAAVRSMMQSWHNFFFNSFDPGGFVTIDKPPLGFWFQVLSAKVFGYNGVSLLLPSALAGVLSVWLLYYLVARYFGRGAGLLAALAMAVMPVAVAANRSNIIDSILVFFLLLGAWAVSRAVEQGSLRWLLLCAVLVGLGFNIKMLEAFLVVPAFGAVYLFGAHISWRKRIAHLALATVVLLVVSFSWIAAVDLTPASQRPWVDSTTTNSELDLAIGYNGLERLLGRGSPGGGSGNFGAHAPRSTTTHASSGGTTASTGIQSAASNAGTGNPPALQGVGTSSGQPSVGGAAPGESVNPFNGGGFGARGAGGSFGGRGGDFAGRGGGGGLFNNGAAGPLRLFSQSLGGQASWLLPLALIALAVLATRRRLRWPLDAQDRGVLLWGVWLLTTGAFFSVAGFFHSYYLVTFAPAVAALAGIGVVVLWRFYRQSGWRGWLLPLSVVVTAAVQATLLQPYATWTSWLTPLILGLSILAAVVLVLARLPLRRLLRVWTPVAAAVGVIALLIAPTAWAADTTLNGGGGMTPTAGPSGFSGGGFPGQRGGRVGSFGGGDTTANGLLTYLEQHQGTTKYLLVMQSSTSAASYIIDSGKPVMALGGFSGSDPILTLAQLQALVKNNTVRYFEGVNGSIGQWVQSACKAVPPSDYGASATTSNGGSFGGAGGFSVGGFGGTGGQPNPSSGGAPGTGTPPGGGRGFGGGFGGGFDGRGGGQQLYDCAGAVQ